MFLAVEGALPDKHRGPRRKRASGGKFMGFNELGLSDPVVHGVQSMGFVDPTPIQLRAIPVILSGKDLMGSAQTGT